MQHRAPLVYAIHRARHAHSVLRESHVDQSPESSPRPAPTGLWTGNHFGCTQLASPECPPLTVAGGVVNYHNPAAVARPMALGSTATTSCRGGFSFTPPNALPTQLCIAGGATGAMWAAAQGSCQYTPPPPPVHTTTCYAPMLGRAGGLATLTPQLGSYTAGAVVQVTCATGYTASSPSMTCTNGDFLGTNRVAVTCTHSLCPGATNCGSNGQCRVTTTTVFGNTQQSVRCACSYGYFGDNCQFNAQSCGGGSGCLHGTCIAPAAGQVVPTCNCQGTGYYGARCETDEITVGPPPPPLGAGCNGGAACANGGTCTSYIVMGAAHEHCDCLPGYTGATCGVSDGTTTPPPPPGGTTVTCQNGGTPHTETLFGTTTTTCTCLAGFSGESCQTATHSTVCPAGAPACTAAIFGQPTMTPCSSAFATNCCCAGHQGGGGITPPPPPPTTGPGTTCATAPCLNGGTCIDVFGRRSCTCTVGFGGDSCEEQDEINDCDGGTNPCQNGGVCQDSFFGFECQCQPRFGGNDCSVPEGTSNCLSAPCQNGGACADQFVDNAWSYKCTCAATFFGNHCEQSDVTDDCVNFNCCATGGACQDLFQDAMCVCHGGYTGDTCNIAPGGSTVPLGAAECASGTPPPPPSGGVCPPFAVHCSSPTATGMQHCASLSQANCCCATQIHQTGGGEATVLSATVLSATVPRLPRPLHLPSAATPLQHLRLDRLPGCPQARPTPSGSDARTPARLPATRAGSRSSTLPSLAALAAGARSAVTGCGTTTTWPTSSAGSLVSPTARSSRTAPSRRSAPPRETDCHSSCPAPTSLFSFQ